MLIDGHMQNNAVILRFVILPCGGKVNMGVSEPSPRPKDSSAPLSLIQHSSRRSSLIHPCHEQFRSTSLPDVSEKSSYSSYSRD